MNTLQAAPTPEGFEYKDYHESIQRMAQAIARERNKVYNSSARKDNPAKPIAFNEFELQMLCGGIYKLLRAKNNELSIQKCLDDLVDAYNCIALAFQSLEERLSK